jgi:hypothetical protein
MSPPVVPEVPVFLPRCARACLLALVAAACTRANPAYYPEEPPDQSAVDAAADAFLKSAPDLAADVPPDLVGPDASAPQPDAPPPPTAFSFIEPAPSPAIRPANPGGLPFGDSCGGGRVLVGVIGTSQYPNIDGLNSVQARCAELVLTAGPPALSTRNSTTPTARGTVGPRRHDGTCPQDQVVVGVEAATGQWINRMYVQCAALMVRQEPSGYSVVIGAATRLEVPLGPPSQSGFTISRCPEGKLAVGMEGSSGYAVDWFALRCARPTLR